MASILIVEDEYLLRRLIVAQLAAEGHTVSEAADAAEGLRLFEEGRPDLVLLDLGLPDEDGLVVARQLRARSNVPIIVVTSRKQDEARLAALELGVDDYITKSSNPAELTLRVRNLLARSQTYRTAPDGRQRDVLRFSGWTLDMAGATLTDPGGVTVPLTAGEFRVFCLMARAPGRVLSREQILDALTQGGDPPDLRMVDSFVSRIRRKLGDRRFITTVSGLGYRFEPTPRD